MAETLTQTDAAPAAAAPRDVAGEAAEAADALWPASPPVLGYLSPRAFRTLAAFAAVLLDLPNRRLPLRPFDVALRADRFLTSLRSRVRWRIRAALFALELRPLLSLYPPLSRMTADQRTRFFAARLPVNRGPLLRRIVRLKALVYLCAYGDQRLDAVTGFVPVNKRGPRAAAARRALAATDAGQLPPGALVPSPEPSDGPAAGAVIVPEEWRGHSCPRSGAP